MTRQDKDRAAALAASKASQAQAKRENALYDASPHLAARASPLAQAKAAIAKATGETA